MHQASFRTALSATLHCLTGCAIGEVAGMAIGAALGLSNAVTILLAIALVDNAVVAVVPGAMDAGLGSLLFWGSLSFALVVAGAVAVPLNRFPIERGKGHAVVHRTGVYGGLPPRLVGAAAGGLGVYGAAVLALEAVA